MVDARRFYGSCICWPIIPGSRASGGPGEPHCCHQEIVPRLSAIGQSLDFELVIDVRVVSTLGRGNNEAGIFANHCLVQTSLPGPTRVPEGLPSEHASNAGRRPNSFWPSWPLALVSALIVS